MTNTIILLFNYLLIKGRRQKKKLVLLGGRDQKMATPPPLPQLWSKYKFFLSKNFFLLTIPWNGKKNYQTWKWNFYPPLTVTFDRLKAPVDKGDGVVHPNKIFFVCIYTFWRFLHRMEPKKKLVLFWLKVVVGPRTPPPPQRPPPPKSTNFFWTPPLTS